MLPPNMRRTQEYLARLTSPNEQQKDILLELQIIDRVLEAVNRGEARLAKSLAEDTSSLFVMGPRPGVCPTCGR